MTPKEAQEYIKNISLSWAIFIFGGLFVLSAIDRGNYVVEAFATFLFGTASIYLDQLEEHEGLHLTWTRRALLAVWILIIASRYLSFFQSFNFWAH